MWGLYQPSLTRSTSTLFFHLPRVCVPTERGPGVGSSPRPVGYCSTRVGIRTKNGAHDPTSCALYLATMNDQSSNAIHPSAWNRNSANFAFTEFSEVRLRTGRLACKDSPYGGCARPRCLLP
jgi:hypothetical protein